MTTSKKIPVPPSMTESHCERLVEKGAMKKTGDHTFECLKGRYGSATIRFRPDLPGLPVK